MENAVFILISRKEQWSSAIFQDKVTNFSFMETHTKGRRKSKSKVCNANDEFCQWTNKFNLVKREKALWFSVDSENETGFNTLKYEMEKKSDNEETPFLFAHLFIQKSDKDIAVPKKTDRGVKLIEVQITKALPQSGGYFFEIIAGHAIGINI